jgi:hypothetical protein
VSRDGRLGGFGCWLGWLLGGSVGEICGRNGYLHATTMDREELQHHIDAAAPLGCPEARRLTSLMSGACWPGGPADRTERVARDWLRRWDPDQLSLELPECSCHTGHCVLCN